MIKENITYDVKCSRCGKQIALGVDKKKASEIREPIILDDGRDRDCSRYFRISIENQMSYGYSYEQSYLCNKCKIIALSEAISFLEGVAIYENH